MGGSERECREKWGRPEEERKSEWERGKTAGGRIQNEKGWKEIMTERDRESDRGVRMKRIREGETGRKGLRGLNTFVEEERDE